MSHAATTAFNVLAWQRMSQQAHTASAPTDSSRRIAVPPLRIHPSPDQPGRKLITLLITISLAVSALALSVLPPATRAAAQEQPSESVPAIDDELALALDVLGLTERWAQTATVSPDIARLTAGDDPASLDYLIRRSALLVVAQEFASLRTTFDELEGDIDILIEQMNRSIARSNEFIAQMN